MTSSESELVWEMNFRYMFLNNAQTTSVTSGGEVAYVWRVGVWREGVAVCGEKRERKKTHFLIQVFSKEVSLC